MAGPAAKQCRQSGHTGHTDEPSGYNDCSDHHFSTPGPAEQIELFAENASFHLVLFAVIRVIFLLMKRVMLSLFPRLVEEKVMVQIRMMTSEECVKLAN